MPPVYIVLNHYEVIWLKKLEVLHDIKYIILDYDEQNGKF